MSEQKEFEAQVIKAGVVDVSGEVMSKEAIIGAFLDVVGKPVTLNFSKAIGHVERARIPAEADIVLVDGVVEVSAALEQSIRHGRVFAAPAFQVDSAGYTLQEVSPVPTPVFEGQMPVQLGKEQGEDHDNKKHR